MSKAREKKTPKPTLVPASEATVTDEVREAQKAYLLLQLLDADNETLSKGVANKFRDAVKRSLGFTSAAIANYRRERLAELNYLKITKRGQSTEYSLLSDGKDYLATCISHFERLELRIQGKTLNKLITAARETSFQEKPVPFTPATENPNVEPSQLGEVVMSVFEEIRRESHRELRLVPIHEVRQRISKRLGPAAASHAVLDEVIFSLWREKRIGLEGISDLGSASTQQLHDSIPDNGITFFYLEVPREQPALA